MKRSLAALLSPVLLAIAAVACLNVSDAAPERDASTDGTGATQSGGGSGGSSGGSGGSTGGGAGAEAGPLHKLGETCSFDVDCEAGTFCSAPSVHGASGDAKICVKGCCTSGECAAGEVCYTATGGYGVCLPAATAGRPTVGTGATGSACQMDSDCRSAMCVANVCADSCCSDGDCSALAPACALRLEKFTNRLEFSCGAPAGSGAFGTQCTTSGDCRSGACVGTALVCSKSCCSNGDCGSAGTFGCSYTPVGTNAALRICAPVVSGSGATGSPCTTNSDCHSGWCAGSGSTGVCSDTCCVDSDCGDPAQYACRTLQPPNAPAILLCLKR